MDSGRFSRPPSEPSARCRGCCRSDGSQTSPTGANGGNDLLVGGAGADETQYFRIGKVDLNISVDAGKSKDRKAKLTKKGVRALKRAGGSLLATVLAKTTEPGGVAQDSETILLHR